MQSPKSKQQLPPHPFSSNQPCTHLRPLPRSRTCSTSHTPSPTVGHSHLLGHTSPLKTRQPLPVATRPTLSHASRSIGWRCTAHIKRSSAAGQVWCRPGCPCMVTYSSPSSTFTPFIAAIYHHPHPQTSKIRSPLSKRLSSAPWFRCVKAPQSALD